jgi:hypothetical protein
MMTTITKNRNTASGRGPTSTKRVRFGPVMAAAIVVMLGASATQMPSTQKASITKTSDCVPPAAGAAMLVTADCVDPRFKDPYIDMNFTVRIHALRVLKLRNKFPAIMDAIDPGGSGNPYAGLTEEERQALEEATRLGFGPRLNSN